MSVFGHAVLITGNESLLAQRAVEQRTASALAEQPDAEVNAISASELGERMLSEVVGGSLFASHIVAVIDDIGSCPAEAMEALVSAAKEPGEETALILVHAGGNRGRGLVDKLKKARVEVITVKSPTSNGLRDFVLGEAKGHRLRMDRDAADALVSAVGSDLRTVAGAVSQLAADTQSNEIDIALIRKYFSGRAEVTSFAVADAALAGNSPLAMERLRWALSTGVAHVLITSAMAGNFRAMGKYLDLSGRRYSDGELASRIGVPPFKIRTLSSCSRIWSPAAAADAIRVIAQADAEVKGAATDPDYALERMLLAVLSLK